MARVDFYILSGNENPEHFICSLINKAWLSGNQIYIHVDSEAGGKAIDDLLWTYRDISFLPHELLSQQQTSNSPVSIGYATNYTNDESVMLNLSQEVPAFSNQFERILEIVGDDQHQRQQARQRYKYYRDHSYELHDHKIEQHASNG